MMFDELNKITNKYNPTLFVIAILKYKKYITLTLVQELMNIPFLDKAIIKKNEDIKLRFQHEDRIFYYLLK
jgi:hypothetical protein